MAGELGRYLALDEDELLAARGAELRGEELGFSAAALDGYRRQGQQWFRTRKGEIRARLCPDERIRSIHREEQVNALLEAAAAVDALAGMAGHPIPTILAALSIKYGIKALCHDHPE